MKFKTSLSLAVALVTATTSILADELPTEANQVIDETISAAVPHLVAALEIATKDGDDPEDFTALARSLTAKGLGQTPSLPPWVRDEKEESAAPEKELSEEEKEEAEHHRQEWNERIKRLGESDLKYLKGIDADQNLKTNGEEMSQAIRGYLGFILHDKLNVDNDGDNRLSLQEYALAVPAKGKKDKDGIDWHQRGHFEHDDKNGDGYLDIVEMIGLDTDGIIKRACLAHLVLTLPASDKNEDGSLSEEEFLALGESAKGIWGEVSPEGEAVALDSIYPWFYWVSADDLKTLLP